MDTKRTITEVLTVGLLAAVLTAYGLVQARFFVPACQETDTAGYLILAERMARSGPVAEREEDLFRHQSHVWVENERGEVLPKYTPGYPFLMAAAMRPGGETAAFAVSPVAGGLALVGAFLLFRLWLSPWPAVMATFILASNPMFLSYTNYPLSHAANTCVVTWGMFFLWKWMRRGGIGWAVAAGLTLGCAPLIRPTSAVLLGSAVAAGVTVLFVRPGRGRSWLQAVALVASCAVGIGVLMRYNLEVFGDPIRTGYALTGEQWAYSFARLNRRIVLTIHSLDHEGLPLFFVLGILGIFLNPRRADRWLLGLWVFPILAIYTCYYWGTEDWGMAYTRFFICLLPAFIGSAFVLLELLCVSTRVRCAAMALLCVVVFVSRYNHALGKLADVSAGSVARKQETAADQAARHLKNGAAIFAQEPVHYHIGRAKDFRLYPLTAFDYHRALAELHTYGKMQPRQQPLRTEKITAFYQANRGRLNELKRELVDKFLNEERQVAFLIEQDRLPVEQQSLGGGLRFERLSEWEMPSSGWRRAGGRQRYGTFNVAWGLYEVNR